MKSGCFGLALALVLAPAIARAQDQDVEALIARHIAARGGLAALHAIRTLRMVGTMRPSGFDADLAYSETIERPGRVRIDATLQGLTVVQAYDGAKGWQIQPFQGRKDPEALSADDDKSLAEEADFEDPLVDHAAKGARVEDLGEIDVDGAPAFALRVTLKNGDQQTYYLDPDAFLTVRIVTRQLLRGAESLTQTDFGDYEKVGGVYFPFEVASGPQGGDPQQRVTYKTILANTPVDPALFEPPAGAAATPAPKAPVPAATPPQAPVPVKPRERATTPPPAS